MKKSILFLCLLFIGVSCNSDDNSKPDQGDPLFESEYTPLKSLKELEPGYIYYGAKIGNKPTGIIANTHCLSNNKLLTYINSSNDFESNDSIFFASYIQEKKVDGKCITDYVRTMREVKMQKEGKMYVDIADFFYESVQDTLVEGGIRIDTIKKVHYQGSLDIGMQGGFLRIEGKFSKYDGKEKVYQYFKKM